MIYIKNSILYRFRTSITKIIQTNNPISQYSKLIIQKIYLQKDKSKIYKIKNNQSVFLILITYQKSIQIRSAYQRSYIFSRMAETDKLLSQFPRFIIPFYIDKNQCIDQKQNYKTYRCYLRQNLEQYMQKKQLQTNGHDINIKQDKQKILQAKKHQKTSPNQISNPSNVNKMTQQSNGIQNNSSKSNSQIKNKQKKQNKRILQIEDIFEYSLKVKIINLNKFGQYQQKGDFLNLRKYMSQLARQTTKKSISQRDKRSQFLLYFILQQQSVQKAQSSIEAQKVKQIQYHIDKIDYSQLNQYHPKQVRDLIRSFKLGELNYHQTVNTKPLNYKNSFLYVISQYYSGRSLDRLIYSNWQGLKQHNIVTKIVKELFWQFIKLQQAQPNKNIISLQKIIVNDTDNQDFTSINLLDNSLTTAMFFFNQSKTISFSLQKLESVLPFLWFNNNRTYHERTIQTLTKQKNSKRKLIQNQQKYHKNKQSIQKKKIIKNQQQQQTKKQQFQIKEQIQRQQRQKIQMNDKKIFLSVLLMILCRKTIDFDQQIKIFQKTIASQIQQIQQKLNKEKQSQYFIYNSSIQISKLSTYIKLMQEKKRQTKSKYQQDKLNTIIQQNTQNNEDKQNMQNKLITQNTLIKQKTLITQGQKTQIKQKIQGDQTNKMKQMHKDGQNIKKTQTILQTSEVQLQPLTQFQFYIYSDALKILQNYKIHLKNNLNRKQKMLADLKELKIVFDEKTNIRRNKMYKKNIYLLVSLMPSICKQFLITYRARIDQGILLDQQASQQQINIKTQSILNLFENLNNNHQVQYQKLKFEIWRKKMTNYYDNAKEIVNIISSSFGVVEEINIRNQKINQLEQIINSCQQTNRDIKLIPLQIKPQNISWNNIYQTLFQSQFIKSQRVKQKAFLLKMLNLIYKPKTQLNDNLYFALYFNVNVIQFQDQGKIWWQCFDQNTYDPKTQKLGTHIQNQLVSKLKILNKKISQNKDQKPNLLKLKQNINQLLEYIDSYKKRIYTIQNDQQVQFSYVQNDFNFNIPFYL